jgi:hypothetical protein
MKPLKRVMYISLAVVALLVGTTVHAADIDLTALRQETTKFSSVSNETTVAWWVPEEFWRAGQAKNPNMTETQVETLVRTFRPYTVMVILDYKTGVAGSIVAKSEEFIRANARLLDAQGKSYAPRAEAELDADAKRVIEMIKPMFSNALGSLGQNMHILFFPAMSDAGVRIANAKAKGEFKLKLATKEFTWRLPLEALLPPTLCQTCEREGKGSWSFCPWCGKSLTQK